jgi:hypothetical protein
LHNLHELCIEILDCSLTVLHLTPRDHWRRYHKGRLYAAPASLGLNEWVLSGDWTIRNQATILNEANGRIAYCFHAGDLHLVMGPVAPGTSVRFRVLIDGQTPGAAHGVDEQGNGMVT